MKGTDLTILQACLFQTWHFFILGLIIPVLVLFQLERGLSLIQIGLNMALYSGVVIVLEIPSGILADIAGQKKVYILSVCLKIVAMIIPMLSGNQLLISFTFIVMGAGRAFSSGSLESIFINRISKSGTERDMEKLITRTQIFIPLGLALGALLGGWLPDLNITRIYFITLKDKFSFNFMLIIILGISLAVFFLIFVKENQNIKKESISGPENKTRVMVSLAITYIKNSPVFLVLIISSLAWGLAFSGLETFWQPRVFEITGGDQGTFLYGLLSNGYFLAAVLGSLISWPLCRLLGNKPIIFLFFQRFILGAMFLMISGILNLGWFSVVYITLFLFNGIGNPVEQSILNKEIPSESRATLLSVVSFIMQVGGMAGSMIWGIISQTRGIGFTWKIGAGILILSSFPYLMAHKKKSKKSGVNNGI
jgi:MFS transporter, DHA1 family, quinolone resistance protein